MRLGNGFLKCGITGWCMEVIWTGIQNVKNRDKRLMCTTSLLMFPIYGMAAFIKPMGKILQKRNFVVRGTIYTVCIYITEFATGSILKKRDMCPWDYSDSKYNVKGLIRLDYAPAWFGAGLLFEKILGIEKNSNK